jgi:hypothetical protein
MPFKSHLFRDNRAVEACLTQHAAHLTLGATGFHVAKIHAASIWTAPSSMARSSARRYDPSTASAILSYKRKRNII